MDDIQRKLALIDKQLAGGRELHKQIISTAPLLFVAIGLIAGILIQNTFDLSVWLWLMLLVLFSASSIPYCVPSATLRTSLRIAYRGKETNPAYITAYLALACFVCLGAIRLTSFHRPASNDIRNLINHEFTRINTKKLKIKRLTAENPSTALRTGSENAEEKLRMNSRSFDFAQDTLRGNDKSEERKLATIRGLIITEPYINKNEQWQFAKFRYTDPASSFYLKLGEVETTTGWVETAGVVRVQVAEPVLDLKAGDYIQAYCWLDRFKGVTNPGQFNTARYLARKNVFIAAFVKSRDGIEILRFTQNDRWLGIFTKIKGKLRETATQALVGDLSLEDRSRGLLEALLLGYRRNIDSSTYSAFRKTGLLHFISLSGLHLGILIGIVWWLCKTAGLMKRARAIICIIAIGVFLLIVPPRAPTLRAAIICWVFCVSFFFRRKSNPLNTLSLTAIILLLIRPTNLFEAGWQLSFASVLGIILFTGRIEGFLYEKVTDSFWVEKILKTKLFFRVPPALGSHLLKLFSVGFAAWLGSAGILLYHFYTINPLTSVWTVIVFPLVVGILTFGFLKIIFSFLLPTVAALLGVIVTGLADLLICIVKLFAHLDISHILIGYVPVTIIILYYSIIAFAFFFHFRRPLLKKAICTLMLLTIIIFLGVTKWQRTYRENLVFTCLDVGHGQAILAQLPGRDNILFDAGSLHKNDIGRRVVAAFLNYNGISKIDRIIISHNDVDHINGIPEIVEHCEVSKDDVYANDAFFSKKDQWGTAKFLDEHLNEKGFKIQSLGKKLNVNNSAGIRFLWPSEQICADDELSDNDRSLVSLIEFAGKKILLCSDIGKFAQIELLQLFPALKSEIVVVPHHGSARTLEAGFLENLEADIVIYSCSRTQYEKQQLRDAKNKAKSFYTARDGAVTVCINKEGTVKANIFAKQK